MSLSVPPSPPRPVNNFTTNLRSPHHAGCEESTFSDIHVPFIMPPLSGGIGSRQQKQSTHPGIQVPGVARAVAINGTCVLVKVLASNSNSN